MSNHISCSLLFPFIYRWMVHVVMISPAIDGKRITHVPNMADAGYNPYNVILAYPCFWRCPLSLTLIMYTCVWLVYTVIPKFSPLSCVESWIYQTQSSSGQCNVCYHGRDQKKSQSVPSFMVKWLHQATEEQGFSLHFFILQTLWSLIDILYGFCPHSTHTLGILMECKHEVDEIHIANRENCKIRWHLGVMFTYYLNNWAIRSRILLSFH